MANRANVVVLWHMHQPYYVNPVSDVAILPWVRLHAIKDYYDMAKLLDFFPQMKVNFNLVPSLIVQIEQYVSREITDTFLEYTNKEASSLNDQEKTFILNNFFSCTLAQHIKIYPRYNELYERRGAFNSDLENVLSQFSTQDFLDLQVWFNMTWFGEYCKRYDKVIMDLIAKGADYTEEDKKTVIFKQYEIMGQVISKYRQLQDKEQIELSTSPFYHPILPLIINTDIAKEANPTIKLPSNFSCATDAHRQIALALMFFEQRFGRKPIGLWPPEGAISEETLQVIAEQGLVWTASDGQVLRDSLTKSEQDVASDSCYKPYVFKAGEDKLNLVFRDSKLSDKIGFEYKRWKAQDAVDDFCKHLLNIVDNLEEDVNLPLITIILDGENAWEYYENNGWDFLYQLYEVLSVHERIIPTTIGNYLANNAQRLHLPKIQPGSWINNNFNIWIGHEEDNKAWDMLSKARADIESWQKAKKETFTTGEVKRLAIAWKELYVAEGSDWNWWYGDDYSSKNDREFDEIYRQHLLNIYEVLGLVPPPELFLPIKKLSQTKVQRAIKGIISPSIDGKITDYYEWNNAGCYDTQKTRGVYFGKGLISKIFFGYDARNIYQRIDFTELIDANSEDVVILLNILTPRPSKIAIPFRGDCGANYLQCKDEQQYGRRIVGNIVSAFSKILEIKIPHESLDLVGGENIAFIVSVEQAGGEIERWPVGNIFEFNLPEKDDFASNWLV